MSVLVKGMKVPESCRECPFENYHSDIGQTVCMASLRVLATSFKTISFDGRHCSCPLVALPDKHGDLIDRNGLLRDIEHYHLSDGKFQHWVEVQNTIVEAEDEP